MNMLFQDMLFQDRLNTAEEILVETLGTEKFLDEQWQGLSAGQCSSLYDYITRVHEIDTVITRVHEIDTVRAMQEILAENLGTEGFLDALSRALSADEREELYTHIARGWDIAAVRDVLEEPEERSEQLNEPTDSLTSRGSNARRASATLHTSGRRSQSRNYSRE